MSDIGDYMTVKPASVPVDVTVEETAQSMEIHNIGPLFIKEGMHLSASLPRQVFHRKLFQKG